MPDLTFTETASVHAEFNSALRIELIEVLENARSDLGDLTDITASVAEGPSWRPELPRAAHYSGGFGTVFS